MPYNPNYTYILCRIHGQSNDLGRELLNRVPNSGVYAPYSGLSSTYELKGSSSNSVKVYYRNELTEARLDNYNIDTQFVDAGSFTDHATRAVGEMGSWLSCINDVRAGLDADGNTNDLIVYANSRGGMSATETNETLCLDEGGYLRAGLNNFIEYVLSDDSISNPYLIFEMLQGESNDSNAAEALVSWDKWQVDLKQRFGYAPPFIVNAPGWVRANTIASLETYVVDNDNVFSSYGSTLENSIDQIVTMHNDTGIGVQIDKTNVLTYTEPNLHFNYAVCIQSGKLEAIRIRELATGYGR